MNEELSAQELRTMVVALQTQRDDLRFEISAVRDNNGALRQESEKLRAENEDLRSSNAILRDNNTLLCTEIEALRTQLDNTDHAHDAVSIGLQAAIKENNKLRSSNEALRIEFADFISKGNQHLERLITENKELRAQLEELRAWINAVDSVDFEHWWNTRPRDSA